MHIATFCCAGLQDTGDLTPLAAALRASLALDAQAQAQEVHLSFI